MQSDSFSLDAQLRQIKEQAERDGVEIVKVFADPAQSVYRKKYRPEINAMHEAARRGEFKVLYVHKVDRLARRLEWSLEIVHELQVLVEIFERYVSGKYSDMQITEWLNEQGYLTNRNHPFGKDTVWDMLCNAYYAGKICNRGMRVRPKGVSFHSTPPRVADGQQRAIVSEELWRRSQAVSASRRVEVNTQQKIVRINLLQGLVVCARCGRRLRIQTPKRGPTYYREDSHLHGYRDCSDISQCVRTEAIDTQVGELVQSLKLPSNWEDAVRHICQQQRKGPDPETERRDINNTIRLMRENYERGLYEGEEYQYWQKVGALKEKLDLLCRLPEPAIERVARTLLDLRESWEWATKEERKDLARMIFQEVGVDVAVKRFIWIKARPDFDVLFQLLNNLRVDEHRRFWIAYPEAKEDACDIREELGQEGMEVKIAFPVSHNTLIIVKEFVQ